MSQWQVLILVGVIFFWNYYLFHRLRMSEGYIERLRKEVEALQDWRWRMEHAA